jgi:hypothetical protein
MADEKDILRHWADNHYPRGLHEDEVPVQAPTVRDDSSQLQTNRKYIDSVVFDTSPFDSKEEMARQAMVDRIDPRSRDYPQDTERLIRFVLKHHDREPVPVRLFEVKQQINFKAIGQILAYSEFFPQMYGAGKDVEVVERGIIYSKQDRFVEKAAERNGISLHQVEL